MLEKRNDDLEGPGTMRQREITLKDGRYMVFYTFDDSESAADGEKAAQAAAVETDNDV